MSKYVIFGIIIIVILMVFTKESFAKAKTYSQHPKTHSQHPKKPSILSKIFDKIKKFLKPAI
jgi:hypothetical protein